MITPLLLALTVASGAAPSVAAPSFNTVDVPANVAQFCAEHLSAELTNRGLRVITAAEINALIGMERQKTLLGCGDAQAQSCMAELAAALGTEAVMLGNLAKLGQGYQINIKIIRSDNGVQLSNYLGSAPSFEELLPELTKAADKLASESLRALRPSASAPTDVPVISDAPSSPSNRRWPLIPTIAAGAFGVASGVTFGLAMGKKDYVASGTIQTRTAADATVREGTTFQTVALVTGGLAVAALGTAVVMYFLSDDDSVALVPTSNGFAISGVIR